MTSAAAGPSVALRSDADAADAPGVWTLQRAPLGAARAVLLACALTVAAFVPVFERETDEAAVTAYRNAGMAVVPLMARALAARGKGLLHCLAMQYPVAPAGRQ